MAVPIYSINSLSTKLQIDHRTLKRMISPIWDQLEISRTSRKYLTPNELNVILTFLGIDMIDMTINDKK